MAVAVVVLDRLMNDAGYGFGFCCIATLGVEYACIRT